MGIMPRYDPDAWKRRNAIDKRAMEIDPEAFRSVKIPYYTDEQQCRMMEAMRKAERELYASADHPQG